MQLSAPAALLAGTSSNPLDDLVSIFGGMAAGPPGNVGAGMFPVTSPTVAAAPLSFTMPAPAQSQQQPQQQQEDLLGLF